MTESTSKNSAQYRYNIDNLIQKYTPQHYEQFQPTTTSFTSKNKQQNKQQINHKPISSMLSVSMRPQTIIIDDSPNNNILEGDDQYYDDYHNSYSHGQSSIDISIQSQLYNKNVRKNKQNRLQNRKRFVEEHSDSGKSISQIVTPTKVTQLKMSNITNFIHPFKNDEPLPFNVSRMIEQVLQATDNQKYEEISISLGMKSKNVPKFKVRREMENILSYLQDRTMPQEYLQKFEKLLQK